MSMVFIPGKRLPSLSEIKMSHRVRTLLALNHLGRGWLD